MATSVGYSLPRIVARLETWLAIVYLLISFPLGVFYFTLFLVWFSLGIGLLVVVIGIPILALMFAAARGLAGAERQLASWLLDAQIHDPVPGSGSWLHPWRAFRALIGDSATWKGLVFLILKFPLGIASFVITLVLFSSSIVLISAPLVYSHAPFVLFHRTVDTPAAAAACFLAGVIVGIAAVHISVGLAAMWRALAVALLSPRPAVAVHEAIRTGPIVIP